MATEVNAEVLKPHIVITGNPVQGFFFYGPFQSETEAVDWAEREQSDFEWWIAPLQEPTDE